MQKKKVCTFAYIYTTFLPVVGARARRAIKYTHKDTPAFGSGTTKRHKHSLTNTGKHADPGFKGKSAGAACFRYCFIVLAKLLLSFWFVAGAHDCPTDD